MDYKGLSSNHCNDIVSTDNKRRKISRKEILEKKKAIDEAIRAASSEKNPLSSFPEFRFYCTNGLSVYLESGRGENLSFSVRKYIQNLLKINMKGPYGSEWPAEEKVKRREMVAPEARYILIYESLITNNPSESSIASEAEKNSIKCLAQKGLMMGFVNYRFVTEEEVPVLYVYELQLEPRAQGKGLGKFLMHLIELVAQKNGMGAVVLTVQKGNSGAMSFYMSKLGYLVSTISPSRVNPMIGIGRSYEILCKTFNHEAKAILAEEIVL